MPRLKYKTHITSVDFYKYYASLYFKEIKPGKKNGKIYHGSKYYLTSTQYKRILGKINKTIMDNIINEPLECVLPSRLGIIAIRKRKPRLEYKDGILINNMPFNWVETKKQGKPIRHHNNHSDQYVGRFKWFRSHCNFTNKTAYQFKACRTAKLDLSKVFKDENRSIDYFTI